MRLVRWLQPKTTDDREALMFLAGELWMGVILVGAWCFIHFT